MHPFFNELGVPDELQAFLQLDEPVFYYKDEVEIYHPDLHIVPTTCSLWMAGNYTATELILTSSAMEAIAYLTLRRHSYPVLSACSIIALGNLPALAQLNWIRQYGRKRKITLVFPNDLTGRLTDIFVSAGIRNKSVRLRWGQHQVVCRVNDRIFAADPENLSLNSFEKATGLRSGIRTRKPEMHNSFLTQIRCERQI
ncbi:hypothetical protein [Mucilaginibacter sp. HD30]